MIQKGTSIKTYIVACGVREDIVEGVGFRHILRSFANDDGQLNLVVG